MTALDSSIELQLKKLLAALAEYKATDLHLTVGNSPTLRMADKLVPLTTEPLLTPDYIENIVKALLDEEHFKQLQLLRSVTFTYSFKGRTRYKINVYYQLGYLSITFRIIQQTIKPINMLEIPDQVKNVANFQAGLIIVCGSHGSGKSTVLSSMIEYFNQNFTKHIITIEQPIEYLFTDAKSLVEQREIGIDVPNASSIVDFVSKEDVDVVMLGDVIDWPSLKAALHVTHMGKLVLLELPARSIKDALNLIMDLANENQVMNVNEHLGDLLKAMIGLRAIPNNSGSISLAAEVMLMSPGVKTMIKEKTFDKVDLVIEGGKNEGMLTMQQSINDLTQAGTVNPGI